MTADELFGWLEARRGTGILRVERGVAFHLFSFKDGTLLSEHSNVPEQQVGQILLHRGALREKDLREALQMLEESQDFIGDVLLAQEWVTEKSLKEVLELKIREAVWDVMSWPSGDFHYEDTSEIDGSQEDEGIYRVSPRFSVAVVVGPTLDIGRMQQKRWSTIRATIPDYGARFWVSDNFAVRSSGKTPRGDEQREKLIECIGRGYTVNQMILEHQGRRFQVLSHLVELVEMGAVTIDRRKRPRRISANASPTEVLDSAKAQMDAGDLLGALGLLTRALEIHPEDQDMKLQCRALERKVFAQLSDEYLRQYRVPKILMSEQEIEALDLSDNELYLLGRIDGSWDLLSLLRVVPLREVDTLISFQRLHRRGVIAL